MTLVLELTKKLTLSQLNFPRNCLVKKVNPICKHEKDCSFGLFTVKGNWYIRLIKWFICTPKN